MARKGSTMKKIQKTLMITGALAALMASPALAMIKSIEINADTDSIPSYSAGTAFFPEYEVSDDDADGLTVAFSPEARSAMGSANPTIPATVKFTIQSDSENLDDDLKIIGTGIRSTYVIPCRWTVPRRRAACWCIRFTSCSHRL